MLPLINKTVSFLTEDFENLLEGLDFDDDILAEAMNF